MKQDLGQMFIFSVSFGLFAAIVAAQPLVITAEQLQDWFKGSRKFVLVDVRSNQEYREGHIPGAINIPAERMNADRSRLPKDRSTPIIFYCRGVG